MPRFLPLVLLAFLLVSCGKEETPADQPAGQPGEARPGGGEIVPLNTNLRRPPGKAAEPPVPVEPASPDAALWKEASRLLRSSDAEDRLVAIDRLTAARDRKEAGRLITRLLTDPDEDVRIVAAEALGQIEYRAGADDLRALLGRDEDPTVRKQALQSLVRIAGKGAVDDLLERLADDDANVRAAAVTLLGSSGSKKGVDALIGLISGDDYDFSEQVRLAAVTAIGKLEATKGAEAVIDALEDANELVRTESAKVLGILGVKKAVPGLIRIVDPDESTEESPQVVERAAISLVELTGEKIEFSLRDDFEEQAAARRAWMDWWKEHKGEY